MKNRESGGKRKQQGKRKETEEVTKKRKE